MRERERPEKLVEKVKDRKSFLTFLSSLEEDFAIGDKESRDEPHVYGLVQSATGWYNGVIDQYLEACVAGAKDMKIECDNPWQECAWIMLGGKDYE